MTRAKLISGIVLIFLLGALAGGLGVQVYHKYDRRDNFRRMSLAKKVDYIVARISDKLDLTKDQAVRIRPVVEASEIELRALKDSIDPDMEKIHDQTFARIREMIEPAQQKKLDEIVARIKKFHAGKKKTESRE